MAKYQYVVPILALLASLCHAGPLARPAGDNDEDDHHDKSVARCQSKLDKGAPKCYEDVYFTRFLPPNHDQCCKNYLKMDKENQDCWEYLFDDPSTTLSLELNLVRCKQELEPPATAHNGTFDECKSNLNKGAPDCWEDVYWKHELPGENQDQCCKNFEEMDVMTPVCFAYLFDDPTSTIALRDGLDKCNRKGRARKLLPRKVRR